MKTFEKELYYKEYTSPIAYGYRSTHKVESYVKIKMWFDFKEGLRFSVSTPIMSSCERNPIKAMLRVLEHESIGFSKYQRLKDDCRSNGLWRQLDPEYNNAEHK